ncbi:MAG: hypothetical protein KDC61_08945 [Saprospiraceae bacterium]|nr:hypothetical protein [Saprospiraceae bacterium]MCB0541945.1 hypothetical protein [Saprospiraceae bacterium]MCB0574677.1 hypothetical protein [Saprospiraceae bacterium]MCB9305392.1 hypothetical protein [Lewinellaceae bacterium]MCB9355967.1 hypothetical protein [Lewinellaceae bacterium]
MKTFLFSLLAAALLQTLHAQHDLAVLDGTLSYYPTVSDETPVSSEPAFSVAPATTDNMAHIGFGKGLRQAITLQVLTPTADVLVNREIPAGSKTVKVDLSGFPDGTYTVRFRLGDHTWIKQVVKG